MDRREEVRAIKAAWLTGDRRERFRAIDLMYKASRHDRERRNSFMLMLEQLIELAEAEGLGEFLQVARDGIFGVYSFEDGSANPLFKATGRRIGVEEHARLRTSLAAAMDWLRRTPFDNEKAAREALRLEKKSAWEKFAMSPTNK